jgi:hypothetical protein
MSKTLLIPLLAVIISVMVFSVPDAKATAPFQAGDVFAGVGSGQIKHYTSSGVLVDTLDTTTGSMEQTGMCFDSSGNLYSTSFEAGKASKFNNIGSLISGNWGGPFSTHPESCVLDSTGHIYVSEVDGLNQILKYDATGTLLDSYSPNSQARGTDWIDLASDQKTMYYTSEGTSVKRYDISTKTQLADFATGLSGPCYELRILNSGEVLVACTQQVYRLATDGSIAHTYPLPAGETSFLFAMNINPDGNSFWTAGYNTGHVYHIDTATGSLLSSFTATPNTFSVAGLAIFGQKTVGCEPNCPQPVTISTKLSSSSILLGNSFTDNATLAGVTANATGTITYNVYDSTVTCTGAPLFTSTTSVTDAKATPSSSFTPTKAGDYNVQAVYTGDKHNNGASSLCTDEKVTVLQGTGGPMITTKLSSGTTYLVGPPVTDSSTLTGVTSDASGTVTYNFYYKVKCSGKPVFSSQVEVSDGEIPNSAPFTPTKLGLYKVQAVYSGDTNNKPTTSDCGTERLQVNPITTKTVPLNHSVYLGKSFVDSASLLGVTSDAGGDVTYKFYSGSTCSGDPLFSSQVSVTDAQVPNSAPFTPTQIGDYSIQAFYSGDPNNQPPINNNSCEHIRVLPLNITTKLSVSTTTLGNSIKDKAFLFSNTPDASGTVTYNFYSGDTCSGTPVFTSIKQVTIGKVPNSASFTPTLPGNYNAQAVYSGDANNKGASSVCGTEAFTVTSVEIDLKPLSMGQ